MASHNHSDSDPLSKALEALNNGEYEAALMEAERLQNQNLSIVSKGSLYFILGAANNELGKSNLAILNFLEGLAIIANENQPALMGHFQDEIARILFKTNKLNASQFFLQMAISNFENAGSIDMVASCKKLQDELLSSL